LLLEEDDDDDEDEEPDEEEPEQDEVSLKNFYSLKNKITIIFTEFYHVR
jgi:hypothetical protein